MICVSTHNYGINSITLEIKRDNTSVITAANDKFKMILAAAQYLGFPGINYHPRVISTYPKINSTGVSLTAPLTIKFSEYIKASTYFSSIKLKNLSIGTYNTLSRTISGNGLKIKTTANRTANTWYTITIPKSAIKDIAGNNLQANYTFKFKTGA
jgi:methionine-rich copper-binding protein CopC